MNIYFSQGQIAKSISRLREHHIVFGTTFLVLKLQGAPVGSSMRLQLDHENDLFLRRYYRLNPKSNYYVRILRMGPKAQDWVKHDYASSGLQKVNTATCSKAFLHEKNDNIWGFARDYVSQLKTLLPKGRKVPIFDLAVWLYRDKAWPEETVAADVVQFFIHEFKINHDELAGIWSSDLPESFVGEECFAPRPVPWHVLVELFDSSPPDIKPESSGLLQFLECSEVGPLQSIEFHPRKRLNVITGDNGLGKTFLLDICWWCLSRTWTGRPASPRSEKKAASIKSDISSKGSARVVNDIFDREKEQWVTKQPIPHLAGLVVYARIDGSYAVWDPANPLFTKVDSMRVFQRDEIWNGGPQIQGLIRDWVQWQDRPDKYPFGIFESVLEGLAPPGTLFKIADHNRIAGDHRQMPFIKHSYGSVPLCDESAGFKRIITLAYLIVWAWEEHKINAKRSGSAEETQMVLIIDEIEAHLHPKWQRSLIPALLKLSGYLKRQVNIQFLIATHSPLVLASCEADFNEAEDGLFHLDIRRTGAVVFEELTWNPKGTIDGWLRDVYGLAYPGSLPREEAMRAAEKLRDMETPPIEKIEEVTEQLKRHLPAQDRFWLQWIVFAKAHNVNV